MGSNNGFLKIREADLDELISYQAKALVGKICKRFEILESKEDIKREAKELVYEGMRQVKELVIAYNSGLHLTQFNFVDNKREIPPIQ